MAANRFTPNAMSQIAFKPSITIIVSPREHSGSTQQFLESLYKHTKMPFELVYVDAGSPKHVEKYLVQAATEYNFTLLRSEHFLLPNQSRNLGLSQVTTDYIVFIANDIYVTHGWLERLWQCAQEVNAAVVCPLASAGTPLHGRIYQARSEAQMTAETPSSTRSSPPGDELDLPHHSSRPPQLSRWACDFAELNCLLVKRDIFEQIGYFDPRLLGAQADMDFCFNINRLDGTLFCETTSVVTPVTQRPDHWLDWFFFMLHWSDAWERESLMHFQQKWNLGIDNDFQQCYGDLGQHRHQTCLYPFLRWLTRGHVSTWLEQLAIGVEHWFNQQLTDQYARSSYEAMGSVVHTAAPMTQPMPQPTTVQPKAVANIFS